MDNTDYEKGFYHGLAYALYFNTEPGAKQRSFVAGPAYNAGPEDNFNHDDFIIPARGEHGWETFTKFDPIKFREAFNYLGSGDSGVTTAYQLYSVPDCYEGRIVDRRLMVEVRCSEDDEEIPEGWGDSPDIIIIEQPKEEQL